MSGDLALFVLVEAILGSVSRAEQVCEGGKRRMTGREFALQRGFWLAKDNLDKAWMIKFVEHRVADRRILRLIQK